MLLVTGATGFIGRAVCAELRRRAIPFRAAVRGDHPVHGGETVVVGDIGGGTDWTRALAGANGVIHLAGLAHVAKSTPELEADLDRVNHAATAALAAAAAGASVRRFVLLSTIKVNGDATPDRAFDENDAPHPSDAYSRSKLAAEESVRRAARESNGRLEFTIVRTPLVYGPGVRANFLALLKAVERGVPLPLGAIHNARSMIYVDNLADALIHCAIHPGAANETFFVKDGEGDPSTPTLVRRLASALGRRPRLLPVPMIVLRAGGAVTGRTDSIDRLTGSLVVNASRIAAKTGWTPPVTVDEAFRATAAWFRETARV